MPQEARRDLEPFRGGQAKAPVSQRQLSPPLLVAFTLLTPLLILTSFIKLFEVTPSDISLSCWYVDQNISLLSSQSGKLCVAS